MLDVSLSYSRYKFLGYEFLTWLWYAIENDRPLLGKILQESAALEIGNRLVLENKKGDRSESITIKGDDAGLEEGVLALQKGAMVTELNLCYKVNESEWRFTVKAESLHIGGLKCPATGGVDSPDDLEGAILEKAYLCEMAFTAVDGLFRTFITLRTSEKWEKQVVGKIKKWIQQP